jgi:hypothetical protein
MSNPKVRRCDTVFDDKTMIPGKIMPRPLPYGDVHDTRSWWSSDFGTYVYWTLCGEEMKGGEWWGCGLLEEVTCPDCLKKLREEKE